MNIPTVPSMALLRRRIGLGFALLTIAFLLASLFFNQQLSFLNKQYLILHLTSELVSSFIYLAVVVVVYLQPQAYRFSQSSVLVFGLTIVAIVDYYHAVSYAGMPPLITETSTEKAIFFWFTGRTFELLTFSLILAGVELKGSARRWLLAGLVISMVLILLGNYCLSWFPRLFVPGTGVTSFKSSYELAVGVYSGLLAVLFLNKCRRFSDGRSIYFALSSYSMALCSMLIITYNAPSQLNILIAHGFKIVAAIVVFRSILFEELQFPYMEIDKEKAQKIKAQKETRELSQALDQHAIVAVTDPEGNFLNVNDKFCQLSQYTRNELLGQDWRMFNSDTHSEDFFADLWGTINRGDVWQGDICNKAKDGSLYWVNTTIVPLLNGSGKPTKYIAICADITERKNAEMEVMRLALYDKLTNLPNRQHMHDALSQLPAELPSKATFNALLIMDLDDFKTVNDSLGHHVGDALLVTVASKLEATLQASHFLARLGGDEFAILLRFLGNQKDKASFYAQKYAQKVNDAFRLPLKVNHLDISISTSIGICIFDGRQSDYSAVLKQADIALYQAKKRGKNKVCFFEEELQQKVERRAVLVQELKSAIHKGELTASYQPIMNAKQTLCGYEALARWHSSKLGQVSPAEFIPIAEDINLIVEMGEWMLREACRLVASWQAVEEKKHLSIAVNVSSVQFEEDRFIERVQAIIKETGTRPELIKLEITESLMLNHPEAATQKMHQITELGFQLALDDFGTGFSSLNYITSFPIDIIKIDKSFVDKMLIRSEDESVIKAILNLAEGLNKQVVAEGIETKEQFERLRELNCDFYQGYYLGKPGPVLNT